MFDFRYHVVSLAAVFLALVLGILVGAAISDPALADRAENERLQDDVARLEERLRAAAVREEEDQAAQAFVDATYDALMENRLRELGIAVLVVGSVDETVGSVRTAVERADGTYLRMRALRFASDEIPPGELGRMLGEEFVAGGDTPTWDELSNDFVLERSGALIDPADGVVVVVTTGVEDDPPAADFLEGLLAGVEGSVPAVGVVGDPSLLDLLDDSGVSIVDNVTTAIGRVSLAVLLAGGTPGHYGVAEGRDALVPPIEAVVPETDAGA